MREWLQRQNDHDRENIFVDLNWCSTCHQSRCRLEYEFCLLKQYTYFIEPSVSIYSI